MSAAPDNNYKSAIVEFSVFPTVVFLATVRSVP
jgi:hypothetical protein